MSTAKWTLVTVVAVLVVIVLASALYVVEEPEFAIVLQFGRVVATRTEPGLYMKTPFVQDVKVFDRRLKEWDGEPSKVKTVEKREIVVNTWARWHITNPRRFYEALRTESAGQGVLDGNVDASVWNVISAQPLMEALRNTQRHLKYHAKELEDAELARNIVINEGRDKVVEMILERARTDTEEKYGFVIDGLGVRHFNYVDKLIPDIYERMRSERQRIANLYESEGREAEAKILGEMKKELEEIVSKADREEAIIRGQADAEAVKIYAQAYGQDEDFYAFVKSLETLKETVSENTRLVITTKSPLYRYLKEIR
ncbi:MAG: protease modulator HflC [Planctomycetota bacterium]|jgi:membrane protease subunit HflC